MALPFLVSTLSYISFLQLGNSRKEDISSSNIDKLVAEQSPASTKPGPGGLKRSESEYSLGLTRNKAFNSDINEVGSFCTTGELVMMSLKVVGGVVLAGAVVAQFATNQSNLA